MQAPNLTLLEDGHLAIVRFKHRHRCRPSDHDATVAQSALLVNELFTHTSCPRSYTSPREKLILPLTKDYAKSDLCYGFLEQQDTDFIAIIGAAAERSGCEWMLARGTTPVEYGERGSRSFMDLEWWNDKDCPGTIEFRVSEREVIDRFCHFVNRNPRANRSTWALPPRNLELSLRSCSSPAIRATTSAHKYAHSGHSSRPAPHCAGASTSVQACSTIRWSPNCARRVSAACMSEIIGSANSTHPVGHTWLPTWHSTFRSSSSSPSCDCPWLLAWEEQRRRPTP